jgi:hypothetical protein
VLVSASLAVYACGDYLRKARRYDFGPFFIDNTLSEKNYNRRGKQKNWYWWEFEERIVVKDM